MRYPFFATFVLFVIWFNVVLAKRNRKDDEQQRAFWRREHAANNVRKKPLDDLPYIAIPVDDLHLDLAGGLSDKKAANEAKRIQSLYDEEAKIVNFTGYSNTDLKLEYGTANITKLSEYDANYTTLVTALHAFGNGLYDEGFYKEAKDVLAFAVESGTDVSATYALLTDIYRTKLSLTDEEISQKLNDMLLKAEDIRSLSKDRIVRDLKEAL